MNIIIDYFKHTGKLPCRHHHHFAGEEENIIKTGFKLPPEKALAWLKERGKNLKTTVSWDDLDSSSHDKAFTVAKVMTADLLQEFYNLTEKAKSEGWSMQKFQDEALPSAERAGWSGNKLHRLRVIYNTNMMMAYSQGKYQQQALLADQGLYPYLEYMPSTSEEPNPVHKHFYNMILRFDDPFWKRHFPPSRHGCQCSTRSVSQKEVDKRGLEIVKGDDLIKQITSDPLLNQYYEAESKSRLNPLETWKPKTDVYVSGIRAELEKFIESQKKQDIPTNDNELKIIDKTLKAAEFKKLIKEYSDTHKSTLTTLDDYKKSDFGKEHLDYLNKLSDKTTNSLNNYLGSGYTAINENLRSGKVNKDYETLKKGDLNHELTQDKVLFRGEKYNDEGYKQVYENLIKSDSIIQLFSTSTNYSVAERFGAFDQTNINSIIYIVKIKKGSKVGLGTAYEQEVILDMGTKYKITSITNAKIQKCTKTIVELEVI